MKQRSDLQCKVRRVSYDFNARTGTLEMAPNNCCHMPGCIALFEGIDPKVKRIYTYAGTVPDTGYERSPDRWIAKIA